MEFVYLKPDAKKRLYLTKDVQEEYGFDECPVKAEKRRDALVIYRHEHADGFRDLMKLGEKFKSFKGKAPLQLKREAQELMAREMGK